jgi:hypothetical protein
MCLASRQKHPINTLPIFYDIPFEAFITASSSVVPYLPCATIFLPAGTLKINSVLKRKAPCGDAQGKTTWDTRCAARRDLSAIAGLAVMMSSGRLWVRRLFHDACPRRPDIVSLYFFFSFFFTAPGVSVPLAKPD